MVTPLSVTVALSAIDILKLPPSVSVNVSPLWATVSDVTKDKLMVVPAYAAAVDRTVVRTAIDMLVIFIVHPPIMNFAKTSYCKISI